MKKNYQTENKNTTSRLFAVQALFQMEAVGKSVKQIKRELKEKFQKEQFEESTLIKPNALSIFIKKIIRVTNVLFIVSSF